jgi:predicted type IV restriction endonuclease
LVQTEEATKNAFILPFIRLVLGYDHTDPAEVLPEFTADVGIKKGEKVDYAIFIDDKPAILIECKAAKTDLDKEHASQMYRYFSVTEAKFGILTNGIVYRFYTDIDEPNKMDQKPFFEIDLTNVKDNDVKELKQFTKEAFNMEHIIESASELKYKNEMKKIMAEQLKEPSDEFVRLFAKQVYNGILTKNAMAQFTQITKLALNQFIKEQVEERLKTALGTSEEINGNTEEITLKPAKNEIITTEEEWDGFYIIRSILCELVDPERVTIRDRQSYCGVLLDDNQLKVICRMRFNSPKQKYIGFFDSQERHKGGGRKEDKIAINNLSDIYKHGERLKNTVKHYIDEN